MKTYQEVDADMQRRMQECEKRWHDFPETVRLNAMLGYAMGVAVQRGVDIERLIEASPTGDAKLL